MHIRCWDELVQYGAMDILRREYGSLLQAEPEPEYSVSLLIDLEQAPPEGGKLSPKIIESLDPVLFVSQRKGRASSSLSPS